MTEIPQNCSNVSECVCVVCLQFKIACLFIYYVQVCIVATKLRINKCFVLFPSPTRCFFRVKLNICARKLSSCVFKSIFIGFARCTICLSVAEGASSQSSTLLQLLLPLIIVHTLQCALMLAAIRDAI